MAGVSSRLGAIFKVRATETRMVALLAGLIFLACTGGAVGSPGIAALFYARFGVQYLPYMFIAAGLVTIATSLLLTALFARTVPTQRYVILPLALALVLMVARVVVAFDFNWFYPVLWLGMTLMWAVQGLLCWGLAGFVCDTRQAKRLFPLFGAGGILGLAIGSLLTKPLVGWLQTENLILVWTVALVLVAYLARVLLRGARVRSPARHRKLTRWLDPMRQGFRYVRRTPLMQWMSLAAVLFAILYYSVVFPFASAAAAEFPQEDQLAAFLGIVQGLSTTVAILISLFLSNRLYARFGFMATILVQPIIYFVGFTLLSFHGAFPILVGFRMTQIAWAEGVSEGANQGMFNIVPSEQREPTRSFVRGVANQLGVSLAGVMLIAGEQIFQPQHVYMLNAFFALTTTILVWQARRAYGAAAVEALRAGQPSLFFAEEEPFGGFHRDAGAVATVVHGIGHPDAAVRRVSAEILGRLSVPEATNAIIKALPDDDPTVRVSLLRALAQAKAATALLDVVTYLRDPVAEVRLQAVETLRELTGYSRGLSGHLQPLLTDADCTVRCHVAALLLKLGRHEEAEETLLTLATAGPIEARVGALEALAQWRKETACELAVAGLTDPHPTIRSVAARIIVQVDPQACLPSLVKALGDEDQGVCEAVALAIGRVGAPALDATVEALADPALESGALRALAHLSVVRVTQTIRSYAADRAQRALLYHNLWRQSHSLVGDDERKRLLADSLRRKSVSHGVRTLRAMGLLGDRQAIGLAIENLHSPSPGQRANALETLEVTGESNLVRPLLCIWEWDETISGTPDPPSHGWLLKVLRDSDPWLRACAALVARDSDDPQITAELTHLAQNDAESFVRDSALASMNGGNHMDTLATLSLMERVLFLRRVPLFNELPPDDLKQIAAIAGEHFFTDGETIATQGEPGDEMYIIVSGEVLVSAKAKDGMERKIGTRKLGEYVGEMAIISHGERVASLTASGDVRTMSIANKEFEEILRMRPETSLAIIHVLCGRLKESISA
jgi:HEAT repeat protein